MEIIVRAAVRGRDLVKGLLSFARQGLAETAILDLNLLLQEEVKLLEHTVPPRIHLDLDLAPSVLPVKGDGNALTHALMNLCVNAVDAMPETGVLCLRSRNIERSMVEVQVEDSGIGMSKEVLDRAMDPFFTTKEVGKGTGLGLSLVYSIVKSHRGTLHIESEPGRGTRVSLRIPACLEAVDLPKAPPEQTPGEAPRYLGVLLVDDDPLLQASTQLLLEFLGHTVKVVSSGEAAMAELQAGLPCDLVILDMNMPGWGGAETLPRIRGFRPDLPVILATGRVDQIALDLAAGHPHVSLMAKPFALDDLRRGLEAADPA
jgi:CheY-like chemotaxis protein